MPREFAKEFYWSPRWRRARDNFIASRIDIDGGVCQMCHDREGYIVHHVEEINERNIHDANVTTSMQNLMYLCNECHNKLHDKERGRGSRYMFTGDGKIISVEKYKMIPKMPPIDEK